MATLGDLKSRIADEILKRNLTSQIASHIAKAIEFYADRRFWFNEARTTTVTVSGNAYITLPTAVRRIDMLNITVGGSSYEVEPQDWETIEDWSNAASSSGQPTDYARIVSQLRFYPTPNAAYALALLGVTDLAALSTDGSSNAWTNEGADLIAARTRMTLFRDVLRDLEGMNLAKDAITDALAELDRKTTLKIGQGAVRMWL